MGIDNGEDYQIVYSDTPGMLRPQYKLQEGMMSFVRSSVVDADVVLLVVDIFQTDIEEAFPDEKILRALRGTPAALLILVNKVDLLDENPPPEPWGLNLGGASGSSTQQEEKQQQQQQQQQQLSPEREARRAEAAAAARGARHGGRDLAALARRVPRLDRASYLGSTRARSAGRA